MHACALTRHTAALLVFCVALLLPRALPAEYYPPDARTWWRWDDTPYTVYRCGYTHQLLRNVQILGLTLGTVDVETILATFGRTERILHAGIGYYGYRHPETGLFVVFGNPQYMGDGMQEYIVSTRPVFPIEPDKCAPLPPGVDIAGPDSGLSLALTRTDIREMLGTPGASKADRDFYLFEYHRPFTDKDREYFKWAEGNDDAYYDCVSMTTILYENDRPYAIGVTNLCTT